MSSTRMRTMCGLSTPLAKPPSRAVASTSSTATTRVHMLRWSWKVCRMPTTNSPAKVRHTIRKHSPASFYPPRAGDKISVKALVLVLNSTRVYNVIEFGPRAYYLPGAYVSARKYTWPGFGHSNCDTPNALHSVITNLFVVYVDPLAAWWIHWETCVYFIDAEYWCDEKKCLYMKIV